MAENKFSDNFKLICERMLDRAQSSAPQWPAPLFPAARNSALCLLVGQLLNKLPDEDATALIHTIESEQNLDGSWSKVENGAGDLATTLEIVQALSEARPLPVDDLLSSAVKWLEQHLDETDFADDTYYLLASLSHGPKLRAQRWATKVLKSFRSIAKRTEFSAETEMMKPAMEILSKSKVHALGKYKRLLVSQRLDGSWYGSTRATVFSLIALRHTGLSSEDSSYERGWRFLRSQQVWNGEGLAQNPCDNSNFMHATALRSLHALELNPEQIAGSGLSLLHSHRMNGGWAMGGMLPTDLFSTAVCLDALSFMGDVPLETMWSRRRAVYYFLEQQQSDGGWPLFPVEIKKSWKWLNSFKFSSAKSSLETTALAVQALAYNSTDDEREDEALKKAVEFLHGRQEESGFFAADISGSKLFATARAIEALHAAGQTDSRKIIQKAVQALLLAQNSDGGWGETDESNPLHTAWILRALQELQTAPVEAMYVARRYLEKSLDESGLQWSVNVPALPMPFGGDFVNSSDYTILWILEVLAPIELLTSPRRPGSRKRPLFDTNR